MQLKALLKDDDAVSPVIGVILMVAITVILAAVIASFVLGLGGQQTQNPQASFSWDYDESGHSDTDGEGIVELTHDGGDSIPGSELFVRGSGFAPRNADQFSPEAHITENTNKGESWDAAGGNVNDDSEVTSGNSLYIGATSEFELSLVWEPAEGDTSATLSEETGPDA